METSPQRRGQGVLEEYSWNVPVLVGSRSDRECLLARQADGICACLPSDPDLGVLLRPDRGVRCLHALRHQGLEGRRRALAGLRRLPRGYDLPALPYPDDRRWLVHHDMRRDRDLHDDSSGHLRQLHSRAFW